MYEKKDGLIKIILGTLYSGKSTQLIQEVERAVLAKKNVLFVRPKLDKRDYLSRLIPTINNVTIIKVDSLSEIPKDKVYEKVFIDEFQFFSEKVVDEILELTSKGIDVTLAALNADINQNLFPPVAKILPWCETIMKLNSICPECGSEYASIVYRADGGTDASVKEENVETDKEACIYRICCKRCYSRMRAVYKSKENN